MKLFYYTICALLLSPLLAPAIPLEETSTANHTATANSIESISASYRASDFLIVPTASEQDEELRAARVVETNLVAAQPHHPKSPSTKLIDDEGNQQQQLPKFPDDDIQNNAAEEPQEQQELNKNVIAGIVGASGAGLVAVIAVGILVWHTQRRTSTTGGDDKKLCDNDTRKDPKLTSLPPGEPMIVSATFFDDWDQHQHDIHQSISKFPSSTYSAIFAATAPNGSSALHDDTANDVITQTNNNLGEHETAWSSDTGSSDSMSIRNLSSYSVEDSSTTTNTRQQQQFITTTRPNPIALVPSVNSHHQSTTDSIAESTIRSRPSSTSEREQQQHQQEPQKQISILDKDDKYALSLVNRKLLHYPARSRYGFATSSTTIQRPEEKASMSDTAMTSSYNLERLFYPSSSSSGYTHSFPPLTSSDKQEEEINSDENNGQFVTPFDLPASTFLTLPNCPFPLVSRQSILNDPEKRQGVHEIP
ncbi:hypothetical protein BDB00DRAFT_873557 [Zychaea mexicana]|uniref:uncharacterized protein n=1 Tax=Zychaea mexicana TaxID=64656 RepID=UPI0022FE7184|nr:uncharacterized protein BDB00DRAFT_873557 [Zychaea mexicana]KAI9492291.1 hypothetical protein BDB00DRAFT_873557 [Zychaea mexicana]